MIIEIERKFLVKKIPKELSHYNYTIVSGYTSSETTSRVNYIYNDSFEQGFVTFKSKGSLARKEFEYEIPANEAKEIVYDKNICLFTVKKQRYEILINNKLWEVDEYLESVYQGKKWIQLNIAEVELSSIDEKIEIPDWVGTEVTEIKGFSNHKIGMNKSIPEIK